MICTSLGMRSRSAGDADLRTARRIDCGQDNLDRHPAYALSALIVGSSES